MSPRLEDCPNEVIEAIVVLLDLDDIRSLRQSCQSLATKTTQDHFKSYYHSKRVELIPHALRAFVDATQPGRLGCLVQELILIGLTNGVKDQNSKLENDSTEIELKLDLLSQAFNGIVAAKRKSGKLLSLSLEVVVVQDDAEKRLHPTAIARGGWKFVWQSAAQTFHTTLRALASSRLPLEKLDVFNGRQSHSCSLACDELGRVDFQNEGLTISLSSLKSLSISLSDRIIKPTAPASFSQPPNEEDIGKARMKATAQSNFVGLLEFLKLTSLLETLEIHYYQLESARRLLSDPYTHHELLLKQVAESEKLPKLKQCRLRGIYVAEGDLLALIQRTGTRRLFMENVTISSGTFRSILDYCTSETAGMEEFHIEDLFEKHNLLYFRTPSQSDPAQGKTSLQRVGSEAKQPITYHYHQGMVADTPQTRTLRQKRRREYGPP